MIDTFQDTILVALVSGLIGGALAHIDWLLMLGRGAVSQGKTLSASRKAVRMRMGLMSLSIGFGAAGGFLVGLLGHNKLELTIIVALAVAAGLGINVLIRVLRSQV